MKNLVFFISFFIVFEIQAQEYFNRIIPFEYGNPNFSEIKAINDLYFIPLIYTDSTSALIETDLNIENYSYFSNFVFSVYAISNIEEDIYMYGKDRSQQKAMKFGKLNDTHSFEWLNEIETKGYFNFPSTITSLNQNLYHSFTYFENDIYKFGINRSNREGLSIWTKYFEDDIGYSYPWDLIKSKDDNLLFSYTLRYNDETRSSGYVMKLDSLGRKIWRTDPMEKIHSGATPINMTELTNSNLILTFKKDMTNVYEYTCCFHPYPPAFIWLNNQGEFLKEHIFKIPHWDEVNFSEIKKGKGDYFYVCGQHLVDEDGTTEEYYGFITKYTNNGDTIWTHKYRHPDFNSKGNFHYVQDLIELENGDILALGKIFSVGSRNNIWLFKVNNEGCFNEDDCDEIQITTSTNNLNQSEVIQRIYPNPCTNSLTIDTDYKFKKILVYDINGKLQLSNEFSKNIDVSNLTSGLYILVFVDEYSNQIISKFIKY